MPDQPNVSISIAVPVGHYNDPPGKEQLAHFLEHMLFSDRLGRTEEEIRQEISDRGGVYNAFTGEDRTFYFVRIGKEHGLFALQWLYRLISPHGMDPDVVDRQRVPVALEVRARPREFFDWVRAYYIDPPWFRRLGFWEREFGIETWQSRDYYPYRSLSRITQEDLQGFYDTYYVPSLMTLTVIGDLSRKEVMASVADTFATLSPHPEPKFNDTPQDPGRYRQVIFWDFRSNVLYANRFKFYDPTPEQDVMLAFISRFLGERLNDRLRFAERKATYGVRVQVVRNGRAAYLNIHGGIKKGEFDFARSVIERELETLRTRALSDVEFEADRTIVAQQLRTQTVTPEKLESWVSGAFYHPRHRQFPDLVTAFETFTKGQVEAFAREHFVPQRQVLTIIYPFPLSQGVLLAIALGLMWLTVQGLRRCLVRPVPMTRIRYVARFQMPFLYKAVGGIAFLAIVAIGARLLLYLYMVLAERFLVRVDSIALQWPAYAAMFVAMITLFVLVLARVPRKMLVFEDQLLIKYLSYRSVPIVPADITDVALRRFHDIWLSRRIWKCVPLTLGVVSPGIYLRRRDGWAYFFGVQDRDELFAVLEDFKSRGCPAGSRV